MIPTIKAYELVSIEEYNKAKDDYFASQKWTEYKSIPADALEAKWHIIFNKYVSFDPKREKKISKFEEKRIKTANNPNNLSLEQCIDFFENFCFIYETQDPRFKLADTKRADFKRFIFTSIETCETGIITRFNSALELYRNDETKWTQKSLYDYRYLIVMRLSDAYNALNKVSDSMTVHTLPVMIEEAKSQQLGIRTEHKIEDPYTNKAKIKQMKEYFNENYQQFFYEYEKNIVDNLATTLLFEVTKKFGDWKNNSLIIPEQAAFEFTNFLEDRLGFKELNEQPFIHLLGELDENYPFDFTIKSKEEISLLFRQLVKKKLFNEGYFIDLCQANPSNFKFYSDQLTPGKKSLLEFSIQLGVVIDSFDERILRWIPEITDLFEMNSIFLARYPELLWSKIVLKPNLIELIPYKLKNYPPFVESGIQLLSQQINKSIDNKDRNTELLMIYLVDLIKDKLTCFKTLPASLQENPQLALKFIENNYFFIREFPESLRSNKHFADAAIKAHHFYFLYLSSDLKKEYPSSLKKVQEECNALHSIKKPLESIYKKRGKFSLLPKDFTDSTLLQLNTDTADVLLDALFISRLFTAEHLSLKEVVQLTEYLTPEELLEVCSWRSKQRKPSLPYCNIRAIKRFNKEMGKWKYIYKHEQGNWDLNKKTYQHIDSSAKHENSYRDPIFHLAKTNYSWYLGMVRYHHFTWTAYNDSKQLWFDLKELFKKIGTFIAGTLITGSILSVLLALLVYYFVFFELVLSPLLLSCSPPLLIFLCCFLVFAAVLNIYKESYPQLYKFINPIAMVLSLLFGFHFILGLGIWLIGFFYTTFAIDHLREIFKETWFIISHSIIALFSGKDPFLTTSEILYAECENNIAKLKIVAQNEPSQEKVLILEMLWDKINEDLTNDMDKKDNAKISMLLNKHYNIFYKNQTHTVSYNDVNAIKIKENKTFKIQDISKYSSPFRFFRSKPEEKSIPSKGINLCAYKK